MTLLKRALPVALTHPASVIRRGALNLVSIYIIHTYVTFFFNLKSFFFLNNIITLITRYVSKVFGNFDVFSSNHVSFMFGSTQMLGHIVLTNHSTTLADYSSVSFMRHDV